MSISQQLSLLDSPIFPDSNVINGKNALLMCLTCYMVKELAEIRGNMDFYPVEGLNFSDCVKIHNGYIVLFYDEITAQGKRTTNMHL